MKVWITKYALTKGVYEAEVRLSGVSNSMVLDVNHKHLTYHGEGRDWHLTKESAIAKAENLRSARLASLKKQIKALEEMSFEVSK